jgi:serine protease Do
MVLALNGEAIDSARGLIRAVAAITPGNQARLTVRRQGHEVELSVTVGRRPPESAG